MNLADVEKVSIVLPYQGITGHSLDTIGGKESIKWAGLAAGDGPSSVGRIDVAEKHAAQVAAALEQAIIACSSDDWRVASPRFALRRAGNL